MAATNDCSHDEIFLAERKPLTRAVDEADENPSGVMDCNICLNIVQDPVVTFCGHLYCWPCLYQWIQFRSPPSMDSPTQQSQCPVCKAKVSGETLIPLYGRGLIAKPSETKAQDFSLVIPRRPTPKCDSHQQTVSRPTVGAASNLVRGLRSLRHAQQPQPYHRHDNPSGYRASPEFGLGVSITTKNVVHLLLGMLGDMVHARISGHPETTVYAYPYSYNLASGNSSRMRRHLMQADTSLSRLSFFLLCCMIMCLLLF